MAVAKRTRARIRAQTRAYVVIIPSSRALQLLMRIMNTVRRAESADEPGQSCAAPLTNRPDTAGMPREYWRSACGKAMNKMLMTM
jgi:hypothetical protein